MPVIPGPAASSRLPLGQVEQRVAGDWEQRQCPVTRFRFHLGADQLPAPALELPVDAEHVLLQVDVVPPQTEHFTTPDPVHQHQDEAG